VQSLMVSEWITDLYEEQTPC